MRYNPHGFKVDGKTKTTKRSVRHAHLVEVLSELQRAAPAEADIRTFYLFYDTDTVGLPCIFSDEAYDPSAKEWLEATYV